MPDAQVVVAGAGPAGAATAYFLARAGLDVLILDRARFPRDKPCSEYMSPQASRILAEMGALAAVENSGAAQLAGMRVRAPNGAIVHGEFAADHGFRGYRDRGLAVRRTVLDSILLARAVAAGARIEEGTRVCDVIRDHRGRVCGVRTGAGDIDASRRIGKIVVGADGLRSVVGRRLGLTRGSRWQRRLALVTHYTGVEGIGEFGEMHVDRHGYCGFVNVGRGLTNVAVVVPISRAAEMATDRAAFLERWLEERPAVAPMFARARRATPVRATGPFASYTRAAWTPGAALVGDAAEFFDPFTGEGIYAALRGAELLAPFVAESVRALDSGRNPDTPLREYESARRAEFSGKWKVERIVGATIACTPLINRAATVLSRRPDMADLLVGVTGDFVPPREVLRPRYVLNFFLPIPART